MSIHNFECLGADCWVCTILQAASALEKTGQITHADLAESIRIANAADNLISFKKRV